MCTMNKSQNLIVNYLRYFPWKICENLIYLSIDCEDLSKLFFGISSLISLDKLDKIKPAVYYQMINLFVQKYNSFTRP